MIKASIVIATHNKSYMLAKTLTSIFNQQPGFDFEVIVVDDGSKDNTFQIVKKFPEVIYIKLKNDVYRNPAIARNVGNRAARGTVIIQQSDEVVHMNGNVISGLVRSLALRTFCLATVYNYDFNTNTRMEPYTGIMRQRPFFFLGSLFKDDLYAIGGYDEEFVAPGFDDNWMGDCLIHGRGLTPIYLPDVLGYHQNHGRPHNLSQLVQPSKELYEKKCALASAGKIPYLSSGGAWIV